MWSRCARCSEGYESSALSWCGLVHARRCVTGTDARQYWIGGVQARLLRIVEASGAAPQRWEPAVVEQCVQTHHRLLKDVSDVFRVSDVLPLGPLSASLFPPTAADG
jgi:hypothetical protein